MENKEVSKAKRRKYMSATHSVKAFMQNAEMMHKHKLITTEQLNTIRTIHTESIEKWITRKFTTNYKPDEEAN